MNAESRLTVEMRQIATLKPYWRNPRKNDAAVPGVRRSIEEFGFQQPIVIDKAGEIIIGHTRYRAALELEMETVPVVVANLSKKKAKELRIVDNKTAEHAEWDRPKLIDELRGTDLDLMSCFFDEPDLAKLLSESSGAVFRPVSKADLDKVLDRQGKDGLQSLIDRPQVGKQIKLECPDCAHEFYIDRTIIEEHAGEK